MLKKIGLISFFCILSASNVLTQDDKMTKEDIAATLKTFGASCDPPPTDENIDEIIAHKEDPSHETKCFERCLVVMMEMNMPDSNHVNAEKLAEFSGMMYPKRTDDIKEMAKACNTKIEGIEDECEATHAHSMCMLNMAKEKGFEIPTFD